MKVEGIFFKVRVFRLPLHIDVCYLDYCMVQWLLFFSTEVL